MTPSHDALERALSLLSGYEPEYGGLDLSSHVPMASEALDRLGAADEIGAYVDGWLPTLRPRVATRPLDGFWDRVDQAQAAIDADGADATLVAWFDRIGPGLVGGAFHGTLRVAHALRGLARADGAATRTELAHALAYAAGVASPLPPLPMGGTRPLAEVLDELAPSVAAERPAGLISPQLRARIGDVAALVARLGEARLPDDARAAARALRDQAARIFACGSFRDSARFTLLHTVTGMDAIVAMVDALPPALGERLVRHAAVALAAMLVAFGGPIDRPVAPVARTWDAQRAAATASRDDHAIKLASAVHEAIADGADAPPYQAALERWLAALRR